MQSEVANNPMEGQEKVCQCKKNAEEWTRGNSSDIRVPGEPLLPISPLTV